MRSLAMMMSVNLADDLEHFVRDAVHTGRYASADSVISDALVQLRSTITAFEPNLDQNSDQVAPGKPLTKQRFQRHLKDIGLLDESHGRPGGDQDADSLIDEEGEVVSEVVIRERLIEWLTGFL
jgi:putative addiction module CopG family antidote